MKEEKEQELMNVKRESIDLESQINTLKEENEETLKALQNELNSVKKVKVVWKLS